MSKSYIPGDVVRLSVTIKDAAGVLADPGGLSLVVQSPSLSKTTVAGITKSSVGNYTAEYQVPNAAVPGVWAWRWELSAPNAGASEGVFTVAESLIKP